MSRVVRVTGPFSLEATCAPVDWGRGRWPNEDWIGGALVWVGWEDDQVVFRQVRTEATGSVLEFAGDADPDRDRAWAIARLGIARTPPAPVDPVIARIFAKYPGLRPHMSGSIFSGLVDSIVGQSITVKAAAVVSARIASQFHPGVELEGRIFWPAPRAEDLADADASRLRRTGLTWRRAEALIASARASLDGRLPEPAHASVDELRTRLLELPLVGRWTAESALLWGIGESDAFPMGDVALLRAAREAYGAPQMSMKEMDFLAQGWMGHRAWAARFLWIELFGPARPRATFEE